MRGPFALMRSQSCNNRTKRAQNRCCGDYAPVGGFAAGIAFLAAIARTIASGEISSPWCTCPRLQDRTGAQMIRKLKSGQYRLYSRKKNPKTGRRRNLGTFKSLAAAKKHERAVQFFKRGG